jgi:hypothetical protein
VFTFFAPGIESAPPGALPRLPALERLLGRGKRRDLPGSPWAFLAQLAGGDLAQWPVGPVSALGELAAPPRRCLRVEPLGADAEQQGAFRLPAATLAIEAAEAEALAAAFGEAFQAEGVQLVVATPERWYLAWAQGHPAADGWQGFGGPAQSLDAAMRPAPPEAALRLLLSETEMLFHAHPVNVARRDRDAASIAGLHPWGGGSLRSGPEPQPWIAGNREEPFLAGLRRLGVVGGAPGRPHFTGAEGGVAWPAAIETLGVRTLSGLETAWAVPLLAALQRGRLPGVRIVTGRAIHETRRRDALRFWRRGRPLAESC